jgi:signal transduction histidine kinase
LQRRAARDGRQEDLASSAAALEALDRINQMIADLLDVSRLERGTFAIAPRPVALSELVEEAIATFETAPREIQLEISSAITTSVDPERLRQAIENLIRNAIEHGDEGTSVTVKVGSESRPDGTWAYIAVSNVGPEIPSELSSRLFTPFAAGSGSFGLGLGLYIANRIATVHGGELSISSQVGQGACFQLSLPAETPPIERTTDHRSGH